MEAFPKANTVLQLESSLTTKAFSRCVCAVQHTLIARSFGSFARRCRQTRVHTNHTVYTVVYVHKVVIGEIEEECEPLCGQGICACRSSFPSPIHSADIHVVSARKSPST